MELGDCIPVAFAFFSFGGSHIGMRQEGVEVVRGVVGDDTREKQVTEKTGMRRYGSHSDSALK